MMRRLSVAIQLLSLAGAVLAGGNREFRATWVITWEHISPSLSAEQNKANVRAILDRHKAANMNAVLWQCRQSGTAYYNSSFEPWGYYAGYQYPGYDPLAYAVEEAHKRGMELHAWFNVFQVSSTYPGAPAVVHPEWICRDRDGNPMTSNIAFSPGLEAVRAYTIAVAMEIVRNYDIDGLHLDYVRWNEYSNSKLSKKLAKMAEQQQWLDGMIAPEQVQDLQENAAGRYLYDIEHPYSAGVPAGFASWEDWWRWSVTEFVRVLHDSIQAVKPWVRLSPAALGKYNWSSWQGYGTVYQDAALWFNEGYVEQLTPMHYHWLTPDGFYAMLVGPSESWGPWIQKGISEGRLFTVGPGSYQFAEEKVWYRHPAVVEICRTVPWVDGFQFFSYASWQAYQYWEEAGRTFFARKTKVRPGWSPHGESPDPPTIALTKVDSLHYLITVTPPASITAPHRYAIYRSEDDVIDPEQDCIVHIHFGTQPYSVLEQFDGRQDFNGSYRYAATVLDRYWNESAPSSVVQTDAIPSFAPVVVATDPAEGDTVPVNVAITLVFSKTMNQASVQGALTFQPAIEVTRFSWQDGKTLQVVPARLQFATTYLVTVGAEAQDINGRRLDGNGDGVEGDPFTLHFTTRAVDDVGPKVAFSYPSFPAGLEPFDVDDVITLVFDELIRPETVTDTTVWLSTGGAAVSIEALVTAVPDRSLISIKGWQPLLPDADYILELRNTVRDTTGNQMAEGFALGFHTAQAHYVETRMIDDFSASGNWEQPSYSGSTSGIVVANSTFGISKDVYLPASATRPVSKRSAFLTYEWMETPPPQGYLLREYLKTGPPRDVVFDTTYTLQVYLYGDASGNKFRFCLDEGTGTDWPYHEVSDWVTIDWYGWRLVEWRLSDPRSVGTWIGDGVLNGAAYRIDSFQLTRGESGAIKGRLYFDNLRLVKKSTEPVRVVQEGQEPPRSFMLYPAYPNPFNPTTTIAFDIAAQGHVRLTVFDVTGREVTTLIDGPLAPGRYRAEFDGTGLPSGAYFCRLMSEGQAMTRKMALAR
ncbi:MAG: family 10 glycosylhydrolase [candidate division KSB1 bacterium]|nr:family 10 glycosylhydrolase [candidate division KSB1 bacterium]